MSAPRTDFWLHLLPTGDPCMAGVRLDRRAGAEWTPLSEATVRLDPGDWAREISRLGLTPQAGDEEVLSPAEVRELGRRLADLLLPSPVRELLFALVSAATGPAPVRLRLAVRHPELQRLPFELAYVDRGSSPLSVPAGFDGFFALGTRVSLVRQMDEPRVLPPLPAAPLRVLVASADPRTSAFPHLPRLEEEAQAVLSALRGGGLTGIETRELRRATPALLADELGAWRPHLLHFAGHATRRPTGCALVLHANDLQGHDLVFADELGESLAAAGTRLAVLSACHSGAVGGSGWVLGRIPAVVAMQAAMRDALSGLFARAFYGSLAQGAPVEAALREGRHALSGCGSEWSVPVLHLTADNSEVLAREAPPLPVVAPPPAFREWAPELDQTAPFRVPYRRNARFLGREGFLAQLEDALARPGYPVALVGLGGIGKTQLAVEFAFRGLPHYRQGVFWLDGRSTARLREDVAALANYLDVAAVDSVFDRAERVRDRLQRLREPALLIVDDLAEETDLSLLPAVGPCRLLVTTRHAHLVRECFHAVPVPPLGEAESRRLLQQHRPPASPAEEAAATEIVALVGGLPLALALAGHAIDRLGLSYADYRAWLSDPRHRLDVLGQARLKFRPATGHSGSIFDVLELATRDLGVDARRLLGAAACLGDASIPADLLEATLEGEACADPALVELEEAHLLLHVQGGRLVLHALVRAYALGTLERPEQERALVRLAPEVSRRLAAANERRDWSDVRPEVTHALSLAEHCRSEPFLELRSTLLRGVAEYAFLQCDFHRAEARYREALEGAVQQAANAASPERAGRWRREAAILRRCVGEAELEGGEIPASLGTLRTALEEAVATLPLDDPELGEFPNSLGYACKRAGQLDAALEQYQQALRYFSALPPDSGRELPACLNNIGALLEARGELGTARDYLERALNSETALRGSAHPRVAVRLNNLGRVLRKLGEAETARDLHCQALELHEQAFGPDHLHVAWSRRFLGQAEETLGHPDRARVQFALGLPILERYYGPEHPYVRDLRSWLLPGAK